MDNGEIIDPLAKKDGSPISSGENMKQRTQKGVKYLCQPSRNCRQEPVQQDMHACQNQPTGNSETMMQRQLDNLALCDIQEQREIARHNRAMERDAHRSNLRIEEQYQKQVMRQIHEEIISRENAYCYIRLNGSGNGLYYRKVFSAQIINLQCYRYQGSTEVSWQVTLIEENGGKRVISPLYMQDDLKTLAKLKRTILVMYDNSDSTKSRSFLWEWLHRKLISMLNDADIVEIPLGPGWYGHVEDYHFYTIADEDTTRFSPYMKKFDMFRYSGLDKNTILCSLMDDLEQAGDMGIMGMLLEYRFGASLGRLTEKTCFRSGFMIYGEKSEDVAYYFMRTMINNVDTVNLDSDRMGTIREKVCALQDTPVFFMISDSDNRSVSKHLHDVLSCMQTSCMEGKSVKAPFVFCLKYFSCAIPLEDMLVLDASTIRLPHTDQILDKFQYLVIEMIEKSGSYWVDEIANRYKQYCESGICEAGSMLKMIKDVLLKMFDTVEISRDLYHRFRKLLEAGEAEIEEQLSKKTGRLSEIFKEQVINLVDGGLLTMCDREKAPIAGECDCIYFDLQYYYFTETALKKIGKLAHIDRKSVLQIKKELCELSMVKKYRATGYRQEEMNIDFRICNAYGQRKDLSGLAILREFWDEIGGIALCER